MLYTWDSGNPEVEVSTLLTINMLRNEYKPVFSPLRYSEAVSEHDPIGTNITRVLATDADVPVSSQSVVLDARVV